MKVISYIIAVTAAFAVPAQANIPGFPGVQNDPHFRTWAGVWYDFHGVCDLVLICSKDFAKGLGLDIHIRTKGRYEYSYIESAAVKIGDDTLEVISYGDHILNGVQGAELPATMGADNFVVTHTKKNEKIHLFHIGLVDSDEAIVVSTFKDMVSVAVHNASSADFANSVGMMGHYGDGTLVARDGVTIKEDPNQFGKEWQVKASEPQLFQAPSLFLGKECAPPTAQGRRRLGETISEEAAAKACSHHDDPVMKDMCIFDVMAMGDLEVAEAHGAF